MGKWIHEWVINGWIRRYSINLGSDLRQKDTVSATQLECYNLKMFPFLTFLTNDYVTSLSKWHLSRRLNKVKHKINGLRKAKTFSFALISNSK